MKTYESNFMSIVYNEELSMVEFIWTSESVDLEDSQFRYELCEQVNAVERHRPKTILIDTRKFFFSIAPDTQVWVDKTVYTNWAIAGITKVALLMSPEMIAQLSVEQAIDENSQIQMKTMFFEEKSEALEWFANDVTTKV